MINTLNTIAQNWFTWELAMFWQVGLLIAIIAGLDFLIKKWIWPQVRYALWLLILVKLILPPTLTSPMSFTAEIPFMAKHAAAKFSQTQPPQQIIPPADELIPITTSTQPAQIVPVIPEVSYTPAVERLSWKVYVLFAWLAGVMILSIWLTVRLRNLRAQHTKDPLQNHLPQRLNDLLEATAQKLKLKRTPHIILTDKVRCPAVFGIFRPVLLMPADKLQSLTMEDAENIFLHELAHIKRGDLLVHAVHMILQIAYWFNPPLWMIRRPLQNLREICCDATVARLLREKIVDYRQTLLQTARQLLAVPVDPGLGLLGLFENSGWLIDRLNWLEKKTWRYQSLRITTVFAAICLMTICVIPMAKADSGEADFVIKGRVTDTQTGKPIAGARVSDDKYADGKQWATTNSNGNYSYKTWYEEHNIQCQADGYDRDVKVLLTKLFGSEKEKIINFALEPNTTTITGSNVSEFKQLPDRTVVEIESLQLTNAQVQNYNEASGGKVVAFDVKDAEAKGEVELEPGKYSVYLIMSGKDFDHDAVYVTVGDAKKRVYPPKHPDLSKSKTLSLNITEKKKYPISITFGEPGVLLDKLVLKAVKTVVEAESLQKPTEQSAQKETKQAKALRITIYEDEDEEPEVSVYIPLVAMKIARSVLPSKDKLQLIVEKLEIDEDLPEGLDTETLIDMLDEMLKQVDEGLEATKLLEVKDGTDHIIIELE
ncbi:MAG: hypothetical protein JW806_04725 [Sedimentisphaerales bacterium]|nr:hypothetical protein [Sedimentisphaerales bacterium]